MIRCLRPYASLYQQSVLQVRKLPLLQAFTSVPSRKFAEPTEGQVVIKELSDPEKWDEEVIKKSESAPIIVDFYAK